MLLCVGSFLKNAQFLAKLGFEAMDVDLSAVICTPFLLRERSPGRRLWWL